MKKLIILTALACTVISFASCGSTNNDSTNDNVNLANTNITTTTSDEVDDASSLPDKTNFEKVPDEAVDSFNYMIEATKKLYPETDAKRLYGYIGVETVGKNDCYVFVIYEQTGDVHTEIATIAVQPKNNAMYELDTDNETYKRIELPEDSSSDSSETSWADVVTDSFAGYLSADSENADDVSLEETSDVEVPVETVAPATTK